MRYETTNRNRENETMAIRFTSGQGNTYETYDAGNYDLRILDVTQGTSKNNNPQIKVACEFVGGRYDGKKLTTWYSLTEASMWKLQALVEACGAQHTVVGTDAKGNPIIEFEESDLIGCIFACDLSIQTFEGKASNKIAKERASDLVEDAPAPEPEPKPVAKPAAQQTMARRPRSAAS